MNLTVCRYQKCISWALKLLCNIRTLILVGPQDKSVTTYKGGATWEGVLCLSDTGEKDTTSTVEPR